MKVDGTDPTWPQGVHESSHQSYPSNHCWHAVFSRSADPPEPEARWKIPSKTFHAARVCACCRTLLGCFGFGLMLMKTSSCSMSAVIHCGSTSMSSLMSNINTRGRQPCGVSTKKRRRKFSHVSCTFCLARPATHLFSKWLHLRENSSIPFPPY